MRFSRKNQSSDAYGSPSIGVIFVGARFIAPTVMDTLLTWVAGAINRAPTTLFALLKDGDLCLSEVKSRKQKNVYFLLTAKDDDNTI